MFFAAAPAVGLSATAETFEEVETTIDRSASDMGLAKATKDDGSALAAAFVDFGLGDAESLLLTPHVTPSNDGDSLRRPALRAVNRELSLDDVSAEERSAFYRAPELESACAQALLPLLDGLPLDWISV